MNRLRKTSNDCIALVVRLRKCQYKLDLPFEAYCITRTFAGYHQRSAGAWLWTLECVSSEQHVGYEIGSQWPLREVLRRGFDVGANQWGQISLDPNDLKKDRAF